MPAATADRPRSRRDKQLVRLKARRADLAERREDMLDDIVSGCGYGFLAQKREIRVRTVRWETDRTLDHRRLDRPHRYVRLQGERLANAPKTIAHALLCGDDLAVDSPLKMIEKLDRCHGLARLSPGDPSTRRRASKSVPRRSRWLTRERTAKTA